MNYKVKLLFSKQYDNHYDCYNQEQILINIIKPYIYNPLN